MAIQVSSSSNVSKSSTSSSTSALTQISNAADMGIFEGLNVVDSAFYGAARGLARIPLEHPFDYIKTKWQADPSFPTARSVFLSTYRTNGIKEFYSGAVPSALRSMIRESYRFPLVIILPHFLSSFFRNKDVPENQVGGVSLDTPERRPEVKMLCGLLIATVESITSCPFERIKILLMTTDNKQIRPMFLLQSMMHPQESPEKFYSKKKSSPAVQRSANETFFRYLFRGFGALFLRQILSWVSFLGADAKCKQLVRSYTNKDELNWVSLSLISLTVGSINTAVIMPIDAIKTNMQKTTHSPSRFMINDVPRNNSNVPMTGVQTTKWIYSRSGLRGFYVGTSVRFCQYVLSAFLTVPVLEHLERKNAETRRNLLS